ncbi:GspH/FimT family pseudopilin [Marilutibacter chinensis]|uniref:Type II secretion system protein H n=1 Tax=Marilutibacter chinensis TaxID=2912247 RepID=A0ABS9HWQ4_9GAMM|nr:GspH/FimT family pseudopilin [Lysobacter chinensis]MCF7222619.1 GspH/FimT family pseudopilin [Lysobacter chinensis]
MRIAAIRHATSRVTRLPAGPVRRLVPTDAAGTRGFTLVELMVVLFILGIAGIAVVMTAPGEDTLGREADRFAAGLVRAREEAILGTRAVEVTVTAQGYGFTRQHFGGWQPLREAPFRNRLWPGETRPVLPRGREQIGFRFDPTGAATAGSLVLSRGSDAIEIHVDAAGEVRTDARH